MNKDFNLKVKSSYHIDKLFPDTLYVTNNVCDDLLLPLEESAKKIAEEKKTNRFSNFWVDSTALTAGKEIKNISPFDKLSEYIEYHALNYIKELGYSKRQIAINNMWFNISNEGDFLFPHSHPGSFLSGVYYVKCPYDSMIQFYNSTRLTSNILEPDIQNNPLSQSAANYRCNPGSMIIWMSNFVHGNPRQMVKGEKLAVSFNIDIIRNQ